ncbi:MAG: DOMON domain-containing protein, partial [Candidatus Hodarchaeales archaeon]
MLTNKFNLRMAICFILFLNLFNSLNYKNPLPALASKNQVSSGVIVHFVNPSEVTLDGIISPDEYPTNYFDPISDIEVFFSHNGTDLFVGLVSPSTGWLGIGFGPQGIGMDSANIFIGYIDGETLVWEDHYGVGVNHIRDSVEGGTTDIGDVEGFENETHTIIEFVCPLSSGDIYDHNFVAGGTYGFYVANNPAVDDVTSYHPEHSDTISLTIESSALLTPLDFNPQISIDGIITQNEYGQHFYDPITGIAVFMQHNTTDMFIGLTSPSLGWAGIGFGPKGVGMNGSNIIIGFVNNSDQLNIADFYGIPDYHLSDESDGGTDDIKASAGTENASHTIIEFIFPLASNDLTHDHNFTIWGTYGFFLSRSTADDFVTMHPVHSPTYDFSIVGEKLATKVTLTVTD